jgi:hypothetical protein
VQFCLIINIFRIFVQYPDAKHTFRQQNVDGNAMPVKESAIFQTVGAGPPGCVAEVESPPNAGRQAGVSLMKSHAVLTLRSWTAHF